MSDRSAAEQQVGQAAGELGTLQAFVNTLDIEQGTEELGSPQALANWLHAAGLLEPPGDTAATAAPADLETALELREALRRVLRSHVAPLSAAPLSAAPLSAAPLSAARHGAPEAAAHTLIPPSTEPDQLAGLRRISAGLPTRLEVTADGRIALAAAGSGVSAALARILLIAADAATLGTWPRLKVCSADDCQWAFYDRSPTRSGCWCSMRLCGARAKSRAYRRRAAAPSG